MSLFQSSPPRTRKRGGTSCSSHGCRPRCQRLTQRGALLSRPQEKLALCGSGVAGPSGAGSHQRRACRQEAGGSISHARTIWIASVTRACVRRILACSTAHIACLIADCPFPLLVGSIGPFSAMWTPTITGWMSARALHRPQSCGHRVFFYRESLIVDKEVSRRLRD